MALVTAAFRDWLETSSGMEPYTTFLVKVKNGTTVYPGQMVELSGGYVQPVQTAGVTVLGIVEPSRAVNPNAPGAGSGITGDTSATPIPTVQVMMGRVVVQAAVTGASAVTDQGALVYADVVNTAGDHVLTKTSTNNSGACGRILDWITGTTCRVLLFGSLTSRSAV